MSEVARLADSQTDITVVGHKHPLVPEGEYLAAFLYHETAITFTVPKVYLHFRLVSFGPHFETPLIAAFNARGIVGRPRKNGRFKLGRRSRLYLTMCHLLEGRGVRPDRISLRPLRRLLLKVSVRTVTTDYRQRPLPAIERYSVIDDILSVEEGVL